MVLGKPLGSDVPLEKDIFKKEFDFIKSWSEFAATGAGFEQIIRHASIVNSTTPTTLFTVGANQKLFITSAYASMETGGAVVGASPAGVRATGVPGASLTLVVGLQGVEIDRNANLSRSFPMPIKVESGGVISLLAIGTTSRITGGFEGFTISKKISP